MESKTPNGMPSRPLLYVEARLRDDATEVIRMDMIRNEVRDWIMRKYLTIKVGHTITEFEGLKDGHYIQSIKVVEYTGPERDKPFVRIAMLDLNVQAYQLSATETSTGGSRGQEDTSDVPQSSVLHLPSKHLDGVWESLIFDNDVRVRLLRYINRMMMFSSRNIDSNIIGWNKLILLHGPPGTGKSSLCRALAQKLSIRLSDHYTQGRLIEINSHSLFSKFFSESGKLVGKMFEEIEALAEAEEDIFLCVLIDEVESLTSARKSAAQGNEPSDAIRATNSLLTGVDRLREKRNIIILCTTNLMEAIDSAFIDRIDVKQYIGTPCGQAVYSIYASCMAELTRCGIIIPPPLPFSALQIDGNNAGTRSYFTRYTEMLLNLATAPSAPSSQLWQLSQKSEGMSGRTLRRLPALALALHIVSDPCTVDEALYALRKSIEEEKRQGADADELLLAVD